METIVRDAGLDPTNPRADAIERAKALLEKQGLKGVWLVAPPTVPIDANRDVSILGFDYFDSSERGTHSLDREGILVVTRVESRDTQAELLKDAKPRARSADSAGSAGTDSDDEPASPIRILRTFSIALRDRLPDLPWQSGTYIVDVLLDGHVSNRAIFRLTPGEAAARDPAIAQFIEQHRSTPTTTPTLRPNPADGVTTYQRNAGSLEVPREPGISIDTPRVSVYRAGSRAMLRGSFRLAVPSSAYFRDRVDGTGPSAAVPVTLVITGNIMPGPFVVPLKVASFDSIAFRSEQSMVTGSFEVDLFDLAETSKVPQTYTIWAYSGEFRSQPLVTAFVTPEMLK